MVDTAAQRRARRRPAPPLPAPRAGAAPPAQAPLRPRGAARTRLRSGRCPRPAAAAEQHRSGAASAPGDSRPAAWDIPRLPGGLSLLPSGRPRDGGVRRRRRAQPALRRSCLSLFWSTSDSHCQRGPCQPPCTAFSGCCLSCSSPSPSTQHCGSVTQCSWDSICSVFSWNGNLAQFVPWSSWQLYSSSATAAGGTASCITAQDPSCQNQLMIPT